MRKNHFFVELEDDAGNRARLDGRALMRRECQDELCGFVFFVESNLGGLKCPDCSGPTAGTWGRLQAAFVPEDESDFQIPPQKE